MAPDTLATQLTNALRSSDDAYWTRLRQLMHERGIDPHQSVLAECFPDGEFEEYGIVVSGDGGVFQFVYEWPENNDQGDGAFREWNDRTEDWEKLHLSRAVESAFGLLLGERP
jgi:hypothetical protein